MKNIYKVKKNINISKLESLKTRFKKVYYKGEFNNNRLDIKLLSTINNLEYIRQLIRLGLVLVNGKQVKRAGYKIGNNNIIKIITKPVKNKLDVIYKTNNTTRVILND